MSLSGLIPYSIKEATDQLARLLANMQQASVAVSAQPDKYFLLINHYRSEQNARVKSCTKPKAQKKTKQKNGTNIDLPKNYKGNPKSTAKFCSWSGDSRRRAIHQFGCSANYASYSSRHVSNTGGQRTLDNGQRTTDTEDRTDTGCRGETPKLCNKNRIESTLIERR